MSKEKISHNKIILDRFIMALDNAGLPKHGRGVALTKCTGYSSGQLSAILNNKAPLNDRFIKSVCKEYSINEKWLETGEGSIFKDTSLSLMKAIAEGNVTKVSEPRVNYPSPTQIYHLAGAGNPRVSSGEVVISITLPVDFTKLGMIPVLVKGDSMKPVLLDGAIVGVDTSDKDVVSGKMYAVWIQDEGALIKTLLVGYESITVKSENPLSHTFDVPKAALQDHFVLGRVKWWINQEG